MAISKDTQDFLNLANKKAKKYDLDISINCTNALREHIENSINNIDSDFPEIWEDLIESGLETFVIYMVIKAKRQDAPKLHSALFDEAREEFIQLWPCPRLLRQRTRSRIDEQRN